MASAAGRFRNSGVVPWGEALEAKVTFRVVVELRASFWTRLDRAAGAGLRGRQGVWMSSKSFSDASRAGPCPAVHTMRFRFICIALAAAVAAVATPAATARVGPSIVRTGVLAPGTWAHAGSTGGPFGAIYVDPYTLGWGKSWDHRSKLGAEEAAYGACLRGNSVCYGGIWVGGVACGAVATNSARTVKYYAFAYSTRQARQAIRNRWPRALMITGVCAYKR